MRVLVITGAGVSAESEIPTFRGKDSYWRNLDPAKLATPSAFAKDPGLVWEWYRERRQRIRNAQPNPAHKAIAKLSQQANEFLWSRRTWMICMHALAHRKRRWSKFTEIFLSRAVHAVILEAERKRRTMFRDARNARG